MGTAIYALKKISVRRMRRLATSLAVVSVGLGASCCREPDVEDEHLVVPMAKEHAERSSRVIHTLATENGDIVVFTLRPLFVTELNDLYPTRDSRLEMNFPEWAIQIVIFDVGDQDFRVALDATLIDFPNIPELMADGTWQAMGAWPWFETETRFATHYHGVWGFVVIFTDKGSPETFCRSLIDTADRRSVSIENIDFRDDGLELVIDLVLRFHGGPRHGKICTTQVRFDANGRLTAPFSVDSLVPDDVQG